MYGKLIVGVAFGALVVLCSAALKAAYPRQYETKITTTGEMSGVGAMKIVAQYKILPGIAQVRVDVAAKTTVITAADGVILSPRALWEGMEAAGKTPRSLVGPSGVFNSKPQG